MEFEHNTRDSLWQTGHTGPDEGGESQTWTEMPVVFQRVPGSRAARGLNGSTGTSARKKGNRDLRSTRNSVFVDFFWGGGGSFTHLLRN